MECSSYIPVCARNPNASGFDWHLNNGDANYRGDNIFLPPCTMEKEVPRQIMLNHEATFRYQVQELHRLYRRQRELMDEICTPHLHSQKDIYNEVVKSSLLSRSKGHEKRTLDLEIPADMYHEDDEDTPKKLLDDSELGYVKTGYSSSFDIKRRFLIDLNEPIPPEELASSSTHPLETHMIFRHSEVVNCDRGIDLNSMPISCSVALENRNKETTIEDREENLIPLRPKSDFCYHQVVCSSDQKEKPSNSCFEFQAFTNSSEDKYDKNVDKGNDKMLKMNASVDSNSSSLPLNLEAPVSPENKECLPPRGKSEDVLLSVELDNRTAAETLILISSSMAARCTEETLNENYFRCLYWFAEIVNDELQNEIVELHNTTSCFSRRRRRKTRKCSKLSSTSSERCVLQSWGKFKKRQPRRVRVRGASMQVSCYK